MVRTSRPEALFFSVFFILSFIICPALLWAKPKRYIIRLKDGQSHHALTRGLVRHVNLNFLDNEMRKQRRVKHLALQKVGVMLMEGEAADVKEQLIKNSDVIDYFEEDKIIHLADFEDETAPSSLNLSPWLEDALHLGAQTSPDIHASYSGSGEVLVAVVDTGMHTTHSYLTPARAINAAEFSGSIGVDDDGNGYVDDVFGANVYFKNGQVEDNYVSGPPTQYTDHGSHVAGLVKMIRDQAIPDFADAVKVKILPVRFINESGLGSTSNAILALEYAAQRGAKVLNMSWGAKGTANFSQALYDTCVDLYEIHDMVLIAAAGNADFAGPNNNDSQPYFPANFNLPNLLSVASITPFYSSISGTHLRNEISYFSNYGRNSVHVAAPGHTFESGFNQGVPSVNGLFGVGGPSFAIKYVRKSGTSMAAPLVAGVAGVMRALNPSLTSYEVRKIIQDSALITSDDVGLSSRVKYGRVNAYQAMLQASNYISQNEKPAIPKNKYSSSSIESSGSSSGFAGCGMVTDHNDPGGPFGGNSILLFGLIGLILHFSRRIKFAPKSA